MAICYARLEFLKRTSGKNAVAKSAYNARTKEHFEGNSIANEKTYNWSNFGNPSHHQILLPENVEESFMSPEFLWNSVEKAERKKNAVVGSEMVLALPDDSLISLEDKIHLTRSFVNHYFVSKRFGVQIDIHSPENAIKSNDEEIEKGDHNWHAHIQITPRRFLCDGKTFEKNKPRGEVTELRGGKVISGPNWGKLWAQHQNEYFEEKGLALRVDPTGVVSQKHLGPCRMRGQATAILTENEILIELNQLKSLDPHKILEKIVESKSVFSTEDVDRFLQKHINTDNLAAIKEGFWNLEEIEQLVDKETHQKIPLFSSKSVIEEEAKIIRLADRLHSKHLLPSSKKIQIDPIVSKLSEEQLVAFNNLIKGRKLSCIEGHAGTGKSYLLVALKEYYQIQGIKVRAFGPDNATTKVLKEKGFEETENIYRFLFALHNNKRDISSSKEVWIVDESGKLGNKPFLELLKEAEKHNAQLILSGSASQIASVERGAFFKICCERYGSQFLLDIQRQKYDSHRQMAHSIAIGDVSQAINKLCATGGLHWTLDKENSLQELINFWAKDTTHFPISSSLIVARSNKEIRILNELARQVLKEKGQVGEKEYQCETTLGMIFVSQGDWIEFRKNDEDLKVTNGMSGILTHASATQFVVSMDLGKDGKKTIKFDPRYYHSYQLGYASTHYRSQGRTVDRAYVLHSPGMNKKEFYVGITRHVRTVHFFVSREQAKSLSHLKWQLNQAEEHFSTTQFITQREIDLSYKKNARTTAIQELKESDRFLDRITSHSLIFWDSIKQKGKDLYQSKKDLSSNPAFYSPHINTITHKAKITLISEEEKNTTSLKPATSSPSKPWTFLSQDQKKAFEAYYSSCDKASLLREIVESESKTLATEVKYTPHFREWQEACGSRNFTARKFLEIITHDEIKKLFTEKSFTRLIELSDRYLETKEVVDCGEERFVTNKDLENLTSTLHALNLGGDKTFNAALKEYIVTQEDAQLFKILSEKESAILDSELKEAPHFMEFLQSTKRANQTPTPGQIGDKINDQLCCRHEEMINELVSIPHTLNSKEKKDLLREHSEDIDERNKKFADFSESKKNAIKNYQQSIREATFLSEVLWAEAESQSKDMRELSRFKEMQKAWGLRNENASLLLEKLSSEDLNCIYGDSRIHTIKDQAKRYIDFQERTKNKLITYEELEKRLLNNVDPLLYRLFPEGHSRKEGNKIRFGKKGSLCVNVTGQNAGSYYDFENQEGGGLLKLIGKSQNLSKEDTEKWAKDFLNISNTIEVPKQYQISKKMVEQKETRWVSLLPQCEAPKDLSKAGLGKILKDYQESVRYSYKDSQGNLLFYTLRLVDKNNPEKKIVLPLSYGYWKNQPDHYQWGFKQFTSSERPLYNLHLLKDQPNKPILIVEGEKAANAASNLFPDFVVISWAGGSGAVSKTNWFPLYGKDVVIWADNDKAGFKAGEQICSELRRVGISKLRIVDQEKLSKEFPEKWDLADPFPEDKTIKDIKNMMLLAKERGINPAQVTVRVKGIKSHLVHELKANEILWRVDERMRNNLEKEHGNKIWEINEQIIRETVKILSSEHEIRSKIQQEFGVQESLLDRLTHQSIIFIAHHGKSPSSIYIDCLKEKIRDASWLQEVDQKVQQITKDKEIRDLVLDRTIVYMTGNNNSQDSNQKDVLALATRLARQTTVEKSLQHEKIREHSNQLEI